MSAVNIVVVFSIENAAAAVMRFAVTDIPYSGGVLVHDWIEAHVYIILFGDCSDTKLRQRQKTGT